ncbi:MAG TPA: 4-hydroxy-tetrahydrodipicolinate synthase [Chloroflexota bacterium]|nr:4-hydroxy-tetrahydrodipicolinate synthase [Chloroflexota bacterium]
MTSFGRLVTAMATPFTEAGQIDYAQTVRLARGLVASGSDSLVVSGTTGEAPVLSNDEKIRLFSEVKAAVGNTGKVIAGTGNYNTAESIELTIRAEQVGVDGVLLTVPYYNKPPQEGLYQHFKAIAASTALPCILYNVPSRTVLNMTAETVIRLSAVDNIVGVKEASGNLEQVGEIISRAPRGFLVYSGNDQDTLPILAIGGHGVVSVASHLVGERIAEMIRLAVSGELEPAAAIHRELMPLVRALFLTTNPIPLKAALNSVGFAVGKPRLPLVELDPKQLEGLRSVLRHMHLDRYLVPEPATV